MSVKELALANGTRHAVLILGVLGYGLSYRYCAAETVHASWITSRTYAASALGQFFVPAAWVEANFTGKRVCLRGDAELPGEAQPEFSYTAQPWGCWHSTQRVEETFWLPRF